MFTGFINDGGGQHVVYAKVDSGSSIMGLYYPGTNGVLTAVTATAPVTLDVTSQIFISGSYISQT